MSSFLAALSRALRRFGWIPMEFRGHARFLRKLRNEGNDFHTVVDIGAHRGDWSRVMKRVLPKSRFVLVDVNDFYAKDLRSIGEFVPALLSDSARVVSHFKVGGTGDSYYREQTPLYENLEPIQVEACRADSVRQIPEVVDVLKVDTQGSELDVIKGFGEKIAKTRVIIIEVPIYEYNSGAPTFSEYISAMSNLGFYAAATLGHHYVDDSLYAIDLAFVRKL
jgi:FkbM family methyltransferase